MTHPLPPGPNRPFVSQLRDRLWTVGAALRMAGRRWLRKLGAAIAFYTCLPIPGGWTLDFDGIAALAPLVGLLIGGLLAVVEVLLWFWGMPDLTRSVVVVLSWLALTGGLHLDGAMDTADGLAVPDPQRRLQVMSDSATGAFGAMAGIAILLLKVAALTDFEQPLGLTLAAVAGWARWGQLVAIARYPYLKPEGKGAFHKRTIRDSEDILPGLVILLGLGGIQIASNPDLWRTAVGTALGGFALAIFTGAWFNSRLGGHTGDTYGAVVEWTEALLLCVLTVF